MADFRTHITTSTVIGVGYGAGAHGLFGVPLVPSMVAAGLCSVSGMLPDLDSDSGIPVRETVAFSAAIIPLLMIDRFQAMGMSNEAMALAGGIIYIVIRFGVAELFKRYTIHRGMWHSLPAAAIAFLVAFLVVSCEDVRIRLFKSFAVFLGFVTHLVLDEMYSIDLRRVRLKRSFGTALKLWGGRWWGNISTYGKLILLAFLAFGDPEMMQSWGTFRQEVPHTLTELWERWDAEFHGQGAIDVANDPSHAPDAADTGPRQRDRTSRIWQPPTSSSTPHWQ